ncbi:Uncharacterised protein [uncultured archaeon]|nr:Uncharacterised protein [uncultured archaeon]
MINKKNRLGQEEMVGFAVIAIIVSIGILILLSFMIRSPTKGDTENYQIESFIGSALQYTSDCESDVEFLSVQKLVIACGNDEICLNEKNSCEVLDSTFTNLVKSGWNAGENSSVKGYNLQVLIDGQEKLNVTKGNKTINFKGGFQDFARSGRNYEVSLNVYS